MTSNSGAILGLLMLAGLFAAVPARAEDTPQSCEVPDYLLSSESALRDCRKFYPGLTNGISVVRFATQPALALLAANWGGYLTRASAVVLRRRPGRRHVCR